MWPSSISLLVLPLLVLSSLASSSTLDPTLHRLHKRFTWNFLRIAGKLIEKFDKYPYVHACSWQYGSAKFSTIAANSQRTEACAIALFGPDPLLPDLISGKYYAGGHQPERVYIQNDPKSTSWRPNWNFLGSYDSIANNPAHKFIDEEAVERLFPSFNGGKGNTTRANLAVYQHLEDDLMREIEADIIMPPTTMLEIVQKWNQTINIPGSDFNKNIPTALAISFTCLCTMGTQCSCRNRVSGVGDFYGNLTMKAEDKVQVSLARDEEGRGNATLSFTVKGEVPEDGVVRPQWEYLEEVCRQGGFFYKKGSGGGRVEAGLGWTLASVIGALGFLL